MNKRPITALIAVTLLVEGPGSNSLIFREPALRPLAWQNSKSAGEEAVDLYLRLVGERTDYSQIKLRLIGLLTHPYSVSWQEKFQGFLRVVPESIPDETKSGIFSENIVKLLKGVEIEKEDTFLDDFRNGLSRKSITQRPFINTDELLEAGEKIKLSEMLRRYSESHPDILTDPNEVLILVRENDGAIISKVDTAIGYKEAYDHIKVRPGEYYWVLYKYPCFRLEEKALIEQDFRFDERPMGDEEKKWLYSELSALGDKAENEKRDWREIANEWAAFYKIVDEKITTNLDNVKRLLLYLHESFEDTQPTGPYIRLRLKAIVEIMKVLMDNPEVEDWVAGYAMASYLNQGYKEEPEPDAVYKPWSYRKEFDLLLSLLIERNREDIIPIAIHTFMSRRYHLRPGPGKADMVAFSIFKSEHPGIKRALFFKCLLYSDCPYFFYSSRYGPGKYTPDMYACDQAFTKIIYEILRYLCYIMPREELEETETDTSDGFISRRLGNIFKYLLYEKVIIGLINLLLKEDNPKVRRRLFLVLDRKFFSDVYSPDYKSATHRWIDLALHFHSRYNLPLKDYPGLKKVTEAYPDYRKEKLAKAREKKQEKPSHNSPAISIAIAASA